MRISDWSSDVCSSDLGKARSRPQPAATIPRSGAYQDAMPDINDRDDETQLVRRARRGQEAAFAEIYRRHARAIHSLALRLTGNHATAEDITQECFLKMLQFLGGLRPVTPLRPWLKSVAANATIDRIRRDKRLVALDDDDAQPAAGPEPARHAESGGRLRAVTPVARTQIRLPAMEGRG